LGTKPQISAKRGPRTFVADWQLLTEILAVIAKNLFCRFRNSCGLREAIALVRWILAFIDSAAALVVFSTLR